MLLENSPFPADDRVRREARSLTEAGYRVMIVSPASRGQPRLENFEDITVYRYPRPKEGKGSWGYVWEYSYSLFVISILSLYILFRHGFDVVHAHQPPDMLAWIAGFYKILGKKYIFDHHDLAPELFDARFRKRGNVAIKHFLLMMERFSCRIADHVIATNESYKWIDMQRGGVPERRITVVRNGPDLREVSRVVLKQAREKNNKTIIGYVGVMGVQDGVDYLLRAIHHLVFRLERRDVLCILVGDGSALPDLKMLSQELELGEIVHFTGWVRGQEQVWKYLHMMDICVAPEPSNPYNDQSSAAKIMEYMSAGKPIVSFDLPEHRFSAGDAAMYALPNDEIDFARKLSVLMDDKERQKSMGAIGKERIEKRFAWSFQAENLLNIYEVLL